MIRELEAQVGAVSRCVAAKHILGWVKGPQSRASYANNSRTGRAFLSLTIRNGRLSGARFVWE